MVLRRHRYADKDGRHAEHAVPSGEAPPQSQWTIYALSAVRDVLAPPHQEAVQGGPRWTRSVNGISVSTLGTTIPRPPRSSLLVEAQLTWRMSLVATAAPYESGSSRLEELELCGHTTSLGRPRDPPRRSNSVRKAASHQPQLPQHRAVPSPRATSAVPRGAVGGEIFLTETVACGDDARRSSFRHIREDKIRSGVMAFRMGRCIWGDSGSCFAGRH